MADPTATPDFLRDAAPVEEFAADARTFDLDAIAGRDRPLVIRGLVGDWPAVAAARRSDTDFAQYVAKFDNGAEVATLMIDPEADGNVGYRPDMSAFNYQHFKVPITLGLQRLAKYSRIEHPPGLAIQSALVSECLPELLARNCLPFLDAAVAPRIWIGNRVTTPAHFDSQNNIACVIAGRRRFTLFPPDQLPNLYIGPLDFAPTEAAISLARLDQPDDPRFPRLRKALRHAQVADLYPGDVVFIPPLWWHNVESLTRLNALMNYWWHPVDIEGFTVGHARAALFHCLLAFRALPPAERAHWRQFLDYFVFGPPETFNYIPDAHRGVLGPTTPATIKVLKDGAGKNLA
jgi:hypothetical protein